MQFRDIQNLGWIGAVVGCSALAFGVAWFSKGTPPEDKPLTILPAVGAGAPEVGEPQFSSQVTVHVVGLVKKPGMYKLAGGSRVQDAIDAAGGPGAHADLESINLAQILTDGVQVRVLKVGAAPIEPLPDPSAAPGTSSGGTTARSTSSARPAAKSIALNTASAAELDRLPGVGPSTAAKILEYRRSHGGFASIDELLSVKGIGPKKLKDMRPYLRL